jgi:hypothetical protein
MRMTSITNTILPGSTIEQEKVLFTKEALVDELFLCLAGVKETVTSKENCNKQVTIRKYYRQAKYLIFRIPVYRPTPSFIVNLTDLSDKIKSELEGLDDSRRRIEGGYRKDIRRHQRTLLSSKGQETAQVEAGGIKKK